MAFKGTTGDSRSARLRQCRVGQSRLRGGRGRSQRVRDRSAFDSLCRKSGSCKGRAVPDWQSYFTCPYVPTPAGCVRTIPDVSLYADWGGTPFSHYYLVCFTDPLNSGLPCGSGDPGQWYGAGGTSFATPIWAGIQALVDQYQAGRGGSSFQGNPAPSLYAVARMQYPNRGFMSLPIWCGNHTCGYVGTTATCDSYLGANIGANCVFINIAEGDDNIPCANPSPNCYVPSGQTLQYGLLSTSLKNSPTRVSGDFILQYADWTRLCQRLQFDNQLVLRA